MNLRTGIEFVLLAALWGSSFLFMRIAVPEFGPFALAGLRVTGAGLFLLIILTIKQRNSELFKSWKPIAVVGVFNSGIPFLFFAYAMAHINAGLGSILNSTVPLWGAVVAYFWLKDKMSLTRVFGLILGFSGVAFLVWSNSLSKPLAQTSSTLGNDSNIWAIMACLAATLLYGIAASFTKKYMSNIDSLVSATGSQLSAALPLIPLAVWFWPDQAVSFKAWASVAVLSFFCTAIAYILYFKLLKTLGPAKTMTVTFLIPVFGMSWGALLMNEKITMQMLAACAVIVLGVALTTGLIGIPRRIASFWHSRD